MSLSVSFRGKRKKNKNLLSFNLFFIYVMPSFSDYFYIIYSYFICMREPKSKTFESVPGTVKHFCFCWTPVWPSAALHLRQVHGLHLPGLHKVDKSSLRELHFWPYEVPRPLYLATWMEPGARYAKYFWARSLVEELACKAACSNHPSLPLLIEGGTRKRKT